LIIAEALHGSTGADVVRLGASLAEEIEGVWNVRPRARLLTSSSPRFELERE